MNGRKKKNRKKNKIKHFASLLFIEKKFDKGRIKLVGNVRFAYYELIE